MADVGNLDILAEIQALISDKLQVVSYKWLSRNFSVSSNDAKRMLQEFVEQHGSGLQVIYTLSGWLKKNPPVYHVKLISGLKLSEVREEFEDNYSIQIYSVQASIPKDPAVLWNAEFVQAEELFDQPANVDNCLRDNRFCGVSNSFVKRNANGKSSIVAAPQLKTVGSVASSKSSIPQQLHGKVQQASPKIEQSPAAQPALASTVKSESIAPKANAQDANTLVDKEKATAFPANKRNIKAEKSSSGTGSLSNLWGRALAKSKLSPQAETNDVAPDSMVTAEAQIHTHEAIDAASSDEESNGIYHKRSSNGEDSRKRRVVFDFSDEDDDENAVNLASPDPPRRQPGQDSESCIKNLVVDKNNLNLEAHKEVQTKVKLEKVTDGESSLPQNEEKRVDGKSKGTGVSLPVKTPTLMPEDPVNQKDKATEASSNSPKRRKVLKTRIDERGREVVEVVWEGEMTENKNTDEKNRVVDAADERPTAANKKSPAIASNAPSNPVAKPGAKKTGKGTGTKDPKQGNILSFFKKV